MGLLSRLRSGIQNRVQSRFSSGSGKSGLARAGASKIGVVFTPALEKEWEEIPEQIDAYTKKVGSAIVGSWEVGAAEVGRAVIGMPNDQSLIDRFSDALVPTLAPFQDLHKKAPTVAKAALKAAKSSGRVGDLAPEIQKLTAGLGPEAQAGWVKTVEYLEPLIGLSRDAGLKARMLEAGPRLEKLAVEADQVLVERLAGVAESASLFSGVCDAVEAWQLQLCRDLELALDVPTQELVKALKVR